MSYTTREMINEWVLEGRERGATHLIVVCDTFDYEDYPVYVMPSENLSDRRKNYDGVNMQRIMEVIDLKS